MLLLLPPWICKSEKKRHCFCCFWEQSKDLHIYRESRNEERICIHESNSIQRFGRLD
ncbi:hypothetical protein LINPERHAP2_LOCUS18440, partial [Linum perenne]